MVWFKRLLPIVIIAAAWFGYQYWSDRVERERSLEENRLALVTAQVWTATATYRNDSVQYLAYRDSLLESNNVSVEDLYDYIDRYKNKPEKYLPFTLKVSRLVDSLARLQDSTIRIAPSSPADSAKM